jgi:muconolactone delta-isomerase
MRFLVTTEEKYQMDPEMGPRLLEAMMSWADNYRQKGKLDDVWSFAGWRGGGGILNVTSLEELDQVMGEFPLAPYYKINVYPITDLQKSLEFGIKRFDEMRRR